jgi:hypothetical protein
MEGRRSESYEDFFAAPGAWWPLRSLDHGGTVWHIHTPCGHSGQLASLAEGDPEEHTVVEHDNGAITVEPSIVCTQCGWHGHLRNGVWEQV